MAATISKLPMSMKSHVTCLSLSSNSHRFFNYVPSVGKGRFCCSRSEMKKKIEFVANQRSSDHDGVTGESDQEFVKVLGEMKSYLSVHSERAFVVVLSAEIVATPYLDDILKDLASENDDLKSQVEAACTLVEKLVAENAELVEKVNELYIELDRQSAEIRLSRDTVPDGKTEFAKPAGVAIAVPASGELRSVSAQEFDSLKESSVKDNGGSVDTEHAVAVISNSSLVPDDAGEIVQIPLDDNEIQELELQDAKNAENDAVPVPLTDSPLVGAPFRLISFVAKYVSGADLVNHSLNTSHGLSDTG